MLDGNNSVKVCILHWHYSYVEVEMPQSYENCGRDLCEPSRIPFLTYESWLCMGVGRGGPVEGLGSLWYALLPIRASGALVFHGPCVLEDGCLLKDE